MITLEPRLGHSEAISTMALTRVDVVSLVSPLLCPTAASHLFSFTSCLLFTTRTRINKRRKKVSFPTSFLYDSKRNRGGRTSKKDCQEEFECV